jgi:hypothetical protein
MMVSRRRTLCGLSALALTGAETSLAAGPTITVAKDAKCGCCSGWVAHLRHAGFTVDTRDVTDINRIKARLGVPFDLWTCHTAQVDGYVIEGHVPASVLRRLLTERPQAMGLAVPGMPVGSPGMEVENSPPDEYDVVMFGTTRRAYARFRGAEEISR